MCFKKISMCKRQTPLQPKLEMTNKTHIGFKSHSSQHAPWFGTNLATLQLERLKKIIQDQNEDIFTLKLKCFEAQIKVEKPTANVSALTDRIYQLESENYKLKETCKGQKISTAIFLVFDSFKTGTKKLCT